MPAPFKIGEVELGLPERVGETSISKNRNGIYREESLLGIKEKPINIYRMTIKFGYKPNNP